MGLGLSAPRVGWRSRAAARRGLMALLRRRRSAVIARTPLLVGFIFDQVQGLCLRSDVPFAPEHRCGAPRNALDAIRRSIPTRPIMPLASNCLAYSHSV